MFTKLRFSLFTLLVAFTSSNALAQGICSDLFTQSDLTEQFIQVSDQFMQIYELGRDSKKLNYFARSAQAAERFYSINPERKIYDIFRNSQPLPLQNKQLLMTSYFEIALSPLQQSMALNFGLSRIEAVAIYSYSTEDYKAINPKLRADPSPFEAITTYKVFLNSSLSKLPSYIGQVKRGIKLSASEIAQMQPGQVIEFSAFTSATSDLGLNRFENTHRLIIQSKTGKDISWLSANPSEREVLFMAGTRFRVLSITPHVERNGRIAEWEVQLEEV